MNITRLGKTRMDEVRLLETRMVDPGLLGVLASIEDSMVARGELEDKAVLEEARAAITELQANLAKLQDDFSALLADHQQAMDGRNSEAAARIAAEDKLDSESGLVKKWTEAYRKQGEELDETVRERDDARGAGREMERRALSAESRLGSGKALLDALCGQRHTSEMSAEDRENGDYEGGYDIFVTKVRELRALLYPSAVEIQRNNSE